VPHNRADLEVVSDVGDFPEMRRVVGLGEASHKILLQPTKDSLTYQDSKIGNIFPRKPNDILPALGLQHWFTFASG
jgi:hypothetical protein